MTPDPTLVTCLQCGAELGRYVQVSDQVRLAAGPLVIHLADAACAACGEPFYWRSSERSMALLVARVLAIRRRVYGTVPQIVIE